ncbi:MAG: acetyl-CoA carboxylase biotin carboxyl carrier protein [Pseudomonadota bacterium]|nr:acetyl-CoA carboxylase biotin carboxyl carrier protein [Pseudomonadota bacterium]
MTDKIDRDLLLSLADLLKETGLGELEVEVDGLRVRLAQPAPVTAAASAPLATSAPVVAAGSGDTAPAKGFAAHPGAVKSPMVGTAFTAPEPGAAPFVAVGDAVAAGDTVLIVEAMKVMNAITAPRAGTVRAILVENGQPVEFDEILLVIE